LSQPGWLLLCLCRFLLALCFFWLEQSPYDTAFVLKKYPPLAPRDERASALVSFVLDTFSALTIQIWGANLFQFLTYQHHRLLQLAFSNSLAPDTVWDE